MLRKLLQQAAVPAAADIDAFMAETWAADTSKTVKMKLESYDR
ncbi:MAG: hypothetical protein ACLSGB_08925 [Dorea sp.]